MLNACQGAYELPSMLRKQSHSEDGPRALHSNLAGAYIHFRFGSLSSQPN